jgi:hypothetical protein
MNRLLVVDDEFRNLLEAHSAEELDQLRKNIVRDGRVIDPIVVWEGEDIVVDGMTRYEIALAENVPFTTIDIPFENRQQVKDWIFAHQFGRRNGDGISRARWRAMLVEAKASKISNVRGLKTAIVDSVAKATGVSARQIWSDLAVTEVLDSLTPQAKRNIVHGHIAATPESILSIKDLPESQKSQVCDVLENLPTNVGEDLVFRSVEEVVQAVAEHQSGQPEKPEQKNKRLEQEIAKIERFIAELPARIDSVAEGKKLKRSPWKERVQVAFASFVTIWREQCKKP